MGEEVDENPFREMGTFHAAAPQIITSEMMITT